jgi:hypothetical protein
MGAQLTMIKAACTGPWTSELIMHMSRLDPSTVRGVLHPCGSAARRSGSPLKSDSQHRHHAATPVLCNPRAVFESAALNSAISTYHVSHAWCYCNLCCTHIAVAFRRPRQWSWRLAIRRENKASQSVASQENNIPGSRRCPARHGARQPGSAVANGAAAASRARAKVSRRCWRERIASRPGVLSCWVA